MKRNLIVMLFFTIALTGCSLSNDDDVIKVEILWNLTNVRGGIDGVNNNFEINDIIWSFDQETATLTVTNTNTDDSVEDGLDSGSYSYSITNDGTHFFLLINDTEYGSFTTSETELIIDQNITTSGTGADGFIYKFEKKLAPIE